MAGAALFGDGTATPFGIPGGEEHEATADGDVIRVRRTLRGVVTVRATELPGPWQAARLTVGVTNRDGRRRCSTAERRRCRPRWWRRT